MTTTTAFEVVELAGHDEAGRPAPTLNPRRFLLTSATEVAAFRAACKVPTSAPTERVVHKSGAVLANSLNKELASSAIAKLTDAERSALGL